MSDLKEITRTVEILQNLIQDGARLAELPPETRIALFQAAGRLSRPNNEDKIKRQKSFTFSMRKKIRSQNHVARGSTGIRKAREAAVFQAPQQVDTAEIFKISSKKTLEQTDPRVLDSPRNCYVCKTEFKRLHFFYDSMCEDCATFNYKKRFQTISLLGRVALITGARLKIGYQAALMMLRAGARVIVTTRFPIDAAIRFSQENDFSQWNEKLQIHGLDLRHTPSVEIFCRYIAETTDRLDILINNAAQTVRRPPGFYSHLLSNENLPFEELPPAVQKILKNRELCKNRLNSVCATLPEATQSAQLIAWHSQGPGIGIRASAQLSQTPYTYDNSLKIDEVFPTGKLDADLQQVDLRDTNSWRLKLAEVPAPEMLEVQLVNSVAPFVLCSQLLPIMKRDHTGQKHIVNVTAMEGKFHRFTKIDRHPHTNMAKAALNMLTHTSASDLSKSGIFMNAVDTGWVTDEDPAKLSALKQEVHDFQPPLDIVDGAARVCDPFFDGIATGTHWCGKFLKDYKPIDW